MQNHTRYLVSQRLGRLVATVSTSESVAGQVSLSDEQGCVHVDFLFVPSAVQEKASAADSWPDLAVKIAVAQAHKLHAKQKIQTTRKDVLRLDIQPWCGELSSRPDGVGALGVKSSIRGER